MIVSIGNASAPRWYDLSLDRLDAYVDWLVQAGASCTELVLHHGEADDVIRRVHVLEPDWEAVFRRYQSRGITCHTHAPLHPRFKIARWATDPDGLKADLLPILNAVSSLTQLQAETAVLVIHGASDDREATAGFLNWAGDILQRDCDATLALELRSPRLGEGGGFDRDRESLVDFIEWLGHERAGICWDVAHDWEASASHEDWDPIPSNRFLDRVVHVHLHDANEHGQVHAPLQSARVPWRPMLTALIENGYDRAITMEIRYRFAVAMGDPWNVLDGSYRILSTFLRDNLGIEPRSPSMT